MWFKMKVIWLEIYINISLQLQEFTVNLLQLISYVQLHWTHTKEVEIASLGEKQYKRIYHVKSSLFNIYFLFIKCTYLESRKISTLREKIKHL